MKRTLVMVTLIFATLCASMASGATQAIPLQADRTALDLVDTRGDALLFRVNIAELQAMDVTTSAGDFSRIVIPGFHNSMIDGSPELPMMNRLLELPFGANARVEVVSASRRVVRLADHGITTPLMPHQPSVSKSADLDNLPFIYDRAAYAGTVARELVRVVELGQLRSRGLVRCEISPVEYLPESGELIIHDQIEFRVVFDGVDRAGEADMLARTWSPFFSPLFTNVAGSRANHFDFPDLVKNPVTMVVVTPPEFQYVLTDFVNWKTERGFNMIMGVTGTPEVGATAASIQSYLHGLYNAATPELPAPSFVLFVGDVAQMPTFTEGGDATDRPYCAVDGDLYPDMYYGRFSCTNVSQLQAQLDKTMMYDQFTMPDPSYLGNVTMIAGVDGSFAPTHGNGQINYGTEHYFNAAHGINSYTYLYPASDAAGAPAEIVAHASEGVGFINYTAHGSQTSWSDPAFTQTNINSLTNTGKYFLAIGNCCLTSTYDYGECFGETFLRAAGKGAVGYIGGSNSTYWDEDYWFGVGFHASSGIDGSALPYENTGIGAYDGIFHDHGEAAAQQYVTNDAIIFCGNMTVTESGSSRETYYWNIYNLLGDPSLSTYMGVPTTNPVSHQPVFTNSPDLVIDAAPGSYVGLTQGGVIFAAGTIPAGGRLALPINGVLTPGAAKLVVTAQNREPYVENVPVIVPATVLIDPMAIDANVATDVTVTVYGEDGVTPVVGLSVWAEGLGYATAPVLTDALGVAVLNVTYPYGPTVDIVGRNMADPYELFREPLTVNALALASPDLSVSTGIGMADMFPLNLPADLNATVAEPGFTLHAFLPDGSEMTTGAASMSITAGDLGLVTGVIAVSGYDIYTESFDVIEAFGTMTGVVTAGGGGAAGAVVRLIDGGGIEAYSATCDGAGAYDFGGDILVANYDVVIDYFGYLHYEMPYFVNFGANLYDIALTAAPSGVLTGTLSDSVTGELLEGGIVRVFRHDTGTLYTEAVSDIAGTFTTTALPYFNYDIMVRAYHHVPVIITLEVTDPVVTKDFVLEPTNGDLLIIDDNGAAAAKADKFDEKGNFLAAGYMSEAPKTAAQMASTLELVGYSVTVETSGTTDPSSWSMYDLVIVSCADNTSSLPDAAIRNALINYVDAGGKLLLEGGEVGYNHYGSGAFAERVMHSTDWNHDSSGNFVIAEPTHPVMSVPNAVEDNSPVTYNGYGDQDAMAPLGDAQLVGTWSTYPTDASVICYDPNPAPEGGQIVFMCFNYGALPGSCATGILENAVNWLLVLEAGTSSVTGQVLLSGETNHAGILVEAVPGGGSTFTATDGTYTLPGLFAGEYTIRASKSGWGTQAQAVSLAEGQVTTVDLVLTPVLEFDGCNQPALAIPDNNPAGVSDVMTVDLGYGASTTVSEISVFVDVTHTWQGDLLVTLTSPMGTSVVLHNRTGSSADNIYGWYPTELVPAGDLGVFAGQLTNGDWTLSISDNAGADTGSLNEWCLHMVFSGVVTSEGEPGEGTGLPTAYRLHANYPNPFNPMTNVKFELPHAGMTKVSVYDVSGRLIKTLVNEDLPASVHTVTWDGTNSRGQRVASGTYYLRLSSEDFQAVHKMTMLK